MRKNDAKKGILLAVLAVLLTVVLCVLAVAETACTHKNSLKKTGNNQDATCTQEGYIEYKCTICGGFEYRAIEKLAHIYIPVKSVDGQYVKKVCTMCRSELVLDQNGNTVLDPSEILFPVFGTSFDGVVELSDLEAIFADFALTPYFATVINTDPSGDVYLNVPAGRGSVVSNGYFEIEDKFGQLVSQAYELSFFVKYEEFPTENTALLTWTLDGTPNVILSANKSGQYLDASGNVIGETKGKGWDRVEIRVASTGAYAVYLNGEKVATDSLISLGTSSVFRFFDDQNQFEACLDELQLRRLTLEEELEILPMLEYQVVIGDVATSVGSTVTVDILFAGETPIKTVGVFNLSYDRAAMELVGGKWATDEDVSLQVFDADELSALTFDNNTVASDLRLTLTFNVPEDTEPGDYTVDCDAVVKTMEGNIERALNVDVVSGKVSVYKEIRGDVNGDEQVNSNDAIYLLRHTILPAQYPINQSGDMNGDGDVNSNDAIYLLRYTLLPNQYPLS
jgi:hypothetical protein